MPKTLVGGFQNPSGVSLAGATLKLHLNQPATVTSGINAGQVAPIDVLIILDANGQIPSNTAVFGEDELTPSNTFYLATLTLKSFGQVYGPEVWQIAGSSPVSINSIPPRQSAPPTVNVIGGNVTISGIPTPGQVLVATSTTAADWQDGTPAPAAFNQLTSGTNTIAAMTVGNGATLTHSGTGVIEATEIQGIPVDPTTPLAGQILIFDPIRGKWVPGDPLVQGLFAEGHTTTGLNPVLISGKGADGNQHDLSTDNSGVLNVNAAITFPSSINVSFNSVAQPVTLASTTITGSVAVTGTFYPYSLGQQLAAASVPVVLTAAQLAALTPLSSVNVNNFPATQNVSFNSVAQPVTLTSTTITGSVAVMGPLTDTQLRASAVPVTLTSTTITGSVAVTGTFFQATQPVSGTVAFSNSTIAVTNVGTFATQAACTQTTSPWVVSGTVTTTPPANASSNVAQINGVTPLMGNGITGTGSQRVTIASDNTAFSVNATCTNAGTFATQAAQSGTWTVQPGNTPNTAPWLFQEVPATSGGLPLPFSASLTATAQQVKGSAGQFYGIIAMNNGSVPCYIQVFNLPSASVTVGVTAPDYVIPVPAPSSGTNGAGLAPYINLGYTHTAGITVACTTGRTGSSTATCDVLISYK